MHDIYREDFVFEYEKDSVITMVAKEESVYMEIANG